MDKNSLLKNTEWILRIAVFMTFLGHGSFALMGTVQWLKYLETVGFSIDTAQHLIVMIGALDVIIALVVLLKPYKYIVIWCVIWTFATALIRPLSGEPIWAFIERGSNVGAALALLYVLKINNDNT